MIAIYVKLRSIFQFRELNQHSAQWPVLPKAAAFYILQPGDDYF
jgi:hypothetical protein